MNAIEWRWVLIVAVLDFGTALVADRLSLPFYLDTWATSVGVMVSGLLTGVAGGVLYSIVMALTVWGPAALVWTLTSAAIGALTWACARRGWIDVERPFHLVGAGTVAGAVSVLIAFAVDPIVYPGGNPHDKSLLFEQFFQQSLGSSRVVDRLDDLLVEVTDKIVCLIVAAAVVVLIRERRRSRALQAEARASR